MYTWVSHAQHKGPCLICTIPIVPGDEVYLSQVRNLNTGYTKRRRSHLNCWYYQARTYLSDNPYEPKVKAGPGRPLLYTEDQAALRAKLNQCIIRWQGKKEEFIGMGLWKTAGGYQDKVDKARTELDEMSKVC